MSSEAELGWALAAAAAVCFTENDHTMVYTALGAGETYSAIECMLAIVVRERHALPAKLVGALKTWLDLYTGNESEPRIRRLLNTSGLRAT